VWQFWYVLKQASYIWALHLIHNVNRRKYLHIKIVTLFRPSYALGNKCVAWVRGFRSDFWKMLWKMGSKNCICGLPPSLDKQEYSTRNGGTGSEVWKLLYKICICLLFCSCFRSRITPATLEWRKLLRGTLDASANRSVEGVHQLIAGPYKISRWHVVTTSRSPQVLRIAPSIIPSQRPSTDLAVRATCSIWIRLPPWYLFTVPHSVHTDTFGAKSINTFSHCCTRARPSFLDAPMRSGGGESPPSHSPGIDCWRRHQ